MNRFEKRLCKLLKPFQKKEILIRVINDSDKHSYDEKLDLISKLNSMKDDELNYTFEKVVNDLKKG